MRSAAEAAQVAACTGDPALRVNSAGRGPVSAEWMLPKCLWLNKHERHQTWARAVRVGEYQVSEGDRQAPAPTAGGPQVLELQTCTPSVQFDWLVL